MHGPGPTPFGLVVEVGAAVVSVVAGAAVVVVGAAVVSVVAGAAVVVVGAAVVAVVVGAAVLVVAAVVDVVKAVLVVDEVVSDGSLDSPPKPAAVAAKASLVSPPKIPIPPIASRDTVITTIAYSTSDAPRSDLKALHRF